MKKPLFIIALLLVFLSLSVCGCGEKSTLLTVSVTGDALFDFAAAVRDYNAKSRKNDVKIINAAESADCVFFDTADYEKLRPHCDDMKNQAVYADLSEGGLPLNDGGVFCALPLYAEYGALFYNRRVLSEYLGEDAFINSRERLAAAAEDIAQNKEHTGVENVFAAYRSDARRYADLLIGAAVYYELEINDDYAFTPQAAVNVKRLALRWGDELKSFIDLYKNDCLLTDTPQAALDALIDGKAVFLAAYSADIGGAYTGEDIGVMPVYIGVDGEKNQGLTLFENTFFSVNKKSENKTAANDFLSWLTKNGEKYLKSESALIPYKSAAAKQNGIKRAAALYLDGGYKNIISVSGAFKEDFSRAAADIISAYVRGEADWTATGEAIKAAWEK